jgi:hypothetical protein
VLLLLSVGVFFIVEKVFKGKELMEKSS